MDAGAQIWSAPHPYRSNSQDAQNGCPARPQQASRRRVPLRYVESSSDARTKLAAFFSILLGLQPTLIGKTDIPTISNNDMVKDCNAEELPCRDQSFG